MPTVILKNACLELHKTNRGNILLSSETPEAKKMKDPSKYRPDILHQCLLILLDSPLNKSGNLNILIETVSGKVIKINPKIRIPRVYSRFAGLIVQLLERKTIYSSPEREILMKVESEPVEMFLSEDPICVGLSQQGANLLKWLKAEEKENLNRVVFCINVVSKGEDNFKDMSIFSLSEYSLSAATCSSKICCIAEEILGVF